MAECSGDFWEQSVSHPNLECKVGKELRQRRSDKCTACTVETTLEIDEIAKPVSNRNYSVPQTNVPTSSTHALISALWLGPEAEETGMESDRVRIIELSTALRHIDRALKLWPPAVKK